MPMKRSPCHDHCDQSQKEPEVPQTNMNFLVVGNSQLTRVATLDVFFGGRHSHKKYQLGRAGGRALARRRQTAVVAPPNQVIRIEMLPKLGRATLSRCP